MREILVATLRQSSRRYVATGLAIVLGVAFVAATLVLASTLTTSVRDRITGDVGRHDVVVASPLDGPANSVPASVLPAVRALPGVARVEGTSLGFVSVGGAASDFTTALTWHPVPGLRVTAGAPPEDGSQALVSTSLAERADLAVGSPLELRDANGTSVAVRVSGVVDTSGSGEWADQRLVLGTPAALARWTGSDALDSLAVTAASGVDPRALSQQVATAVARAVPEVTGERPTVRTGPEQADAVAARALKGTDVLTGFLLGFAAVAVFVSALVIGNTFAILLAQRLQQLALVRCVGATRRQVLGAVVGESAAVGAAFSVVGLTLGVGLAAIVSRVATTLRSPLPLDSLSVSLTSVVVPLATGTLVTVLAALLPGVRATRVSPLTALRPEPPASARTRAGLVRRVVAALTALAGAGALVMGAVQGQIGVALAGGVVSAVGVLLGAVVLVPALVRLLGAVARRLGGIPGDLAVENAIRNPSRAAATGSALLVGVTLITMMSVAALSAQQGVTDHLTARFAVDAEVSAAPGALTPQVADRVNRTDGVAGVVTLTSARTRVGALDAGAEQLVTGVPTEQVGRVLRSRELTSFARVEPGTLVVATAVAADLGVTEGGRTSLAGVPMRVHLEQDAPYSVLAATTDLDRAGLRQQPSSLLLRLRDGADPGPVLDRLARSLAGVDQVRVDGAAPQRAELEGIVSVVLAVVTGLLAVAVLIALLGVGNTLSLSVLERGRELALLRALGLTRGQLRASIAVEAALLALVGALAGVVLGIAYGYAGARALVGGLTTVPLVVPWPRLLLVLALALVAAVVAAWLPSRRAARVAPAAGLAID